ncbi:hypothetical protein BS47DRAFT_779480 [Hydnum rufescens UP504]|uniref:Uncharacterized protein n=1 Tax=Hydnum rufescens UP504 TaxID=1448309 RepID=A0A9P6B0L3_9AGAM|nr:hypothetical protein BS47DRAFT_779480 [Hydnum rufescens UP504]
MQDHLKIDCRLYVLLAILRYHFSQVWNNKEKKIEQGRELGLHAREENKQCEKTSYREERTRECGAGGPKENEAQRAMIFRCRKRDRCINKDVRWEARGGILMYKDTRIICRFRVHFAPSVSLGLIVQDDKKSEEDRQQAAINRKWMDLESVDR